MQTQLQWKDQLFYSDKALLFFIVSTLWQKSMGMAPEQLDADGKQSS